MLRQCYLKNCIYFNQRTREECDEFLAILEDSYKAISINAPVKSATSDVRDGYRFFVISINASVKSATYDLDCYGLLAKYFNQRTREECGTGVQITLVEFGTISINAPVKSATRYP